MTIYRYYFNHQTNEVEKTIFSNVEPFLDCFVYKKNWRDGTQTLKRVCEKKQLEEYERYVLYSTNGNKENEFVELVIEQKQQKIRELMEEYNKCTIAIRKLENQRKG